MHCLYFNWYSSIISQRLSTYCDLAHHAYHCRYRTSTKPMCDLISVACNNVKPGFHIQSFKSSVGDRKVFNGARSVWELMQIITNITFPHWSNEMWKTTVDGVDASADVLKLKNRWHDPGRRIWPLIKPWRMRWVRWVLWREYPHSSTSDSHSNHSQETNNFKVSIQRRSSFRKSPHSGHD